MKVYIPANSEHFNYDVTSLTCSLKTESGFTLSGSALTYAQQCIADIAPDTSCDFSITSFRIVGMDQNCERGLYVEYDITVTTDVQFVAYKTSHSRQKLYVMDLERELITTEPESAIKYSIDEALELKDRNYYIEVFAGYRV